MGVDIYGRNPIMRTPPPEKFDLDKYNAMTEEERNAQWETQNEWENQNPGYYFRASWWSWRPIQHAIDQAVLEHDLHIDTTLYGENSGGGPDNQEDCTALANALEQYMLTAEGYSELVDEEDRIYLCLGSWSDQDGVSVYGKTVERELRAQFPEGTFMVGGAVASDGNIYYSTHSTSLYKFREFIKFLRECGGFEIF